MYGSPISIVVVQNKTTPDRLYQIKNEAVQEYEDERCNKDQQNKETISNKENPLCCQFLKLLQYLYDM